MQLYLPVAAVSVDGFLLLGIGLLVGVLSGMFGVGGGFLITPLLFFIGVPPAVAVATSASQIVASSFSAILGHIRKRTVDFSMGWALLGGGLAGSVLGIAVFNMLKAMGQIDLFVQLLYVVFLGSVGTLMFVESITALRRARHAGPHKAPARRQRGWTTALPFRFRFRASGLYLSVIPPVLVGFGVGFLSAIMGVGGGFVMVPAMIYLLGMPTKVVVGTSLFQIIFVAAANTIMHAVTNQTVDMVLAVILIVGGVVGAQIGSQIGIRLKAEQLRVLLALLVLGVGIKLATDLIFEPTEHYSLEWVPAH